MPAAGEIAAATGLAIAAGDAAAGGGGDWPKEVNMSVTEQRLTISSVFIELIGKSFRLEFDEDVRSLYPQRGKCESSKTFAFVFSTFRILAKPPTLFRIIQAFGT
jgi:hypothetical protein